ncbi:MAG: hypothetical protein IKX71_01875 [Bacteroidales bacterium]|nr:hypothetical protein [Bacteroidales bacterium]
MGDGGISHDAVGTDFVIDFNRARLFVHNGGDNLESRLLGSLDNLGAANEYNFGNYYAWGETSPKTKYTWFNYKWGSGSTPWNNITKYNSSDGKTVLDASDDAPEVVCLYWTKELGFNLEATSDNFVYLSVTTRYYGLPIRPVRQR